MASPLARRLVEALNKADVLEQTVLTSEVDAILNAALEREPVVGWKCTSCTCFIGRRRVDSPGRCPHTHDGGADYDTTRCLGNVVRLISIDREEP